MTVCLQGSGPGLLKSFHTLSGVGNGNTRIRSPASFCAPLLSLSLHFTLLHFQHLSYLLTSSKWTDTRALGRKLTFDVIPLHQAILAFNHCVLA